MRPGNGKSKNKNKRRGTVDVTAGARGGLRASAKLETCKWTICLKEAARVRSAARQGVRWRGRDEIAVLTVGMRTTLQPPGARRAAARSEGLVQGRGLAHDTVHLGYRIAHR